MTDYVDLSQPVEPGMTVYPGDPRPSFQAAAGVAAPWRVTDLHLGSHSGTHIDAASHFVPNGKTIEQYPLARLIAPGLIVPALELSEDQPIAPELVVPHLKELPKGGAVLIHTGWDRFWNNDRYLRHPYLSAEATEVLTGAGIGLVGIDALNVDSTVQASDHAHRLLLERDILIVENLAHLDRLQPGRLYQFSFLPILLPGLDGSPVRAVAW
jgi:arylformamidase